MTPNQTNQWAYASQLVRALAESGYFNSDANANRLATIYNNLASWSESNFDMLGNYQLSEAMVNDIVGSATLDSNRPAGDVMEKLVECELVHYGVDYKGNFNYLVGSAN